jgi:tRNA (guanine26-N2/guanine27-N2)-dimethyltransferase
MWLGQLHDREFVGRLMEQVEEQKEMYGTYQRIKGMLSMAKEVCCLVVEESAYTIDTTLSLQELPNALFYFTPAKIASMFHSQCPPFAQYW